MDIGVGAKPARASARLAASGSRTKWPTWSRKISSPRESWRSASGLAACIGGLFPAGLVDPSHTGISGTTCASRTLLRAQDDARRQTCHQPVIVNCDILV